MLSNAAAVAAAIFLLVFFAAGGTAWFVLTRPRTREAGAGPKIRRAPSTASVYLTLAAAAVVSFVAVIAVARLSLWLVEPVLAWMAALFWAVFFRPYGALLLAFVVLVVGLPFSKRFRRPSRFSTGVVFVATAFATFWPLQYVAGLFDFHFREWEALLHGGAFFLSVTLLGAGLEMMRRANNTPQDDSWEFWSS